MKECFFCAEDLRKETYIPYGGLIICTKPSCSKKMFKVLKMRNIEKHLENYKNENWLFLKLFHGHWLKRTFPINPKVLK